MKVAICCFERDVELLEKLGVFDEVYVKNSPQDLRVSVSMLKKSNPDIKILFVFRNDRRKGRCINECMKLNISYAFPNFNSIGHAEDSKSQTSFTDLYIQSGGNLELVGKQISYWLSRSDTPLSMPCELKNKEITWLVEGIVPARSMVLVVGKPSSGKSLIVQDLSASVASGLTFFGNKTKKGHVVYICSEGVDGLTSRYQALEDKYATDFLHNENLSIYPGSIDFLSENSVEEIARHINAQVELRGAPCLIIIDTLARNFGDGDENDNKTMGQFIRRSNDLMNRYNCALVVVHHTGNSGEDRARGASSLFGAVDVSFVVKEQGEHYLVRNNKFKEGQKLKDFQLSKKIIDLKSSSGKGTSSLYLVPRVEGYVASGTNEEKGFDILQKLLAQNLNDQISLEEWKKACDKEGINRKRFSEVKKGLITKQLIKIADDNVMLAA